MKKSKFTEEQIAYVLRQVESGTPLALHRGPAPQPIGPTDRWSMDFVHDALADGQQFRVLTVVDQ